MKISRASAWVRFGSGRRADGVNDPEADVLNLSWQGRLMDYCFHCNDEHCEALVNEVYVYFSDRLENYIPKHSYWRGRSVSNVIAAILILWDRGIVERCRGESGSIQLRSAFNAEQLLLSSVELLPLAEPLLELVGAIRSQASSMAQESA